MSLFRTAPTDGLGAAFADALRAVRRRFFLFGALIVALLTVDLVLFLVTGLPSPAGALAALLTVAVTTRSVVEGRDVSIRETIGGLRAMVPAIVRTIGGGALVGLPLLLVIGTAMAIDPAARTTVALAVDRPLFGAIAWLTAVMAAPFASLPAQAVLYVGGGLWAAVCLHFLFVWQFTLTDGVGGVAAMRASIPLVRRAYGRLFGAGVAVGLFGLTLASIAYLGLSMVAVSLFDAAFGGEPSVGLLLGGLVVMAAVAPFLALTGWYVIATLFVRLRAEVAAATK